MMSPHLAEKLAADALLAGFLVGDHTFARRQDRHAHARADAGNALVANVDAAPGGGEAPHAGDGGLAATAVAQNDDERLGAFALARTHVVDEALALEDL